MTYQLLWRYCSSIYHFGALCLPEELAFRTSVCRNRWEYFESLLIGMSGATLLRTYGWFCSTVDCLGFAHRLGDGDCLSVGLDLLDRTGFATVPRADSGISGTLQVSFIGSTFDDAINRIVTDLKKAGQT